MIVTGLKVPSVTFTGPFGDTLLEIHTLENLLWHWGTTGVVRRVKSKRINAMMDASVATYGPIMPSEREKPWYWTMDMDFANEADAINQTDFL